MLTLQIFDKNIVKEYSIFPRRTRKGGSMQVLKFLGSVLGLVLMQIPASVGIEVIHSIVLGCVTSLLWNWYIVPMSQFPTISTRCGILLVLVYRLISQNDNSDGKITGLLSRLFLTSLVVVIVYHF